MSTLLSWPQSSPPLPSAHTCVCACVQCSGHGRVCWWSRQGCSRLPMWDSVSRSHFLSLGPILCRLGSSRAVLDAAGCREDREPAQRVWCTQCCCTDGTAPPPLLALCPSMPSAHRKPPVPCPVQAWGTCRGMQQEGWQFGGAALQTASARNGRLVCVSPQPPVCSSQIPNPSPATHQCSSMFSYSRLSESSSSMPGTRL